VSKGGNLILNVGPTARGVFDYRAQKALGAIGDWMNVNSRSIYGCGKAPDEFTSPAGTLLTYNPQTRRLYLHLMDYPSSGEIVLHGYKHKVRFAQLLNDDSEIRRREAADNDDVVLTVPANKPPVEIPVIELVLR
jgi:alpha-L-fucosidase